MSGGNRNGKLLAKCYIHHVAKSSASPINQDHLGDRSTPNTGDGTLTIRSAKTGKTVTVKGYGALRDSSFAIRKDIDLTRPIAEQALREPEAKGKAPPRKVPAKG